VSTCIYKEIWAIFEQGELKIPSSWDEWSKRVIYPKRTFKYVFLGLLLRSIRSSVIWLKTFF